MSNSQKTNRFTSQEGKILWQPTESQIQNSQMTEFIHFVNSKYNLSIQKYIDLHNWSVENISEFWQSFWDFSNINYTGVIESVVDDEKKMPGAKWFGGIKLNYAENLLKYRDDKTAVIFIGEGRKPHCLSYKKLYKEVNSIASAMRNAGVVPETESPDFYRICQSQ